MSVLGPDTKARFNLTIGSQVPDLPQPLVLSETAMDSRRPGGDAYIFLITFLDIFFRLFLSFLFIFTSLERPSKDLSRFHVCVCVCVLAS